MSVDLCDIPLSIGIEVGILWLGHAHASAAMALGCNIPSALYHGCREDLTGWRDEASCSSDDEIPHVKLSSPLPSEGSAGNLLQAENALSLKPLLTSAARGNAPNQLPPLPHALAKQAGDLDFLRPACPCPGSPTEPPLPPSTRSSVDDRSSMCSYRSAVAESMASRASSDAHAVDWAAAESSIRGGTPQHGRSSLDGISVVRRSTDGRSSFEGRPPLPGQPARRAEVAEALRAAACAAEPMQSSLLEGQCSGCGSMTACCCKVRLNLPALCHAALYRRLQSD